jgi:hypothetical protein
MSWNIIADDNIFLLRTPIITHLSTTTSQFHIIKTNLETFYFVGLIDFRLKVITDAPSIPYSIASNDHIERIKSLIESYNK